MVADALARTPVGSVEEAVDVMQRLEDALPPADGVWAFNHLYLSVTRAVAASLSASDAGWKDPEFLRRLDVVFANLYFAAFRRAESSLATAPRAWRPLFEARSRPGIAMIQFALAGMNAHINRDLAVAVAETCKERGIEAAHGTDQYDDFTAVNALLESVEGTVKQEYAKGLVGVADHVLGRLDDAVAMWSVSAAREAAWNHAEVYGALPNVPFIKRTMIETLDRTVGFAGRGLLVPVGLP